MKYVVTDEHLDDAHEVYEKACGITAIDWALRAALESFAQTLGEPVSNYPEIPEGSKLGEPVAAPAGWQLVPIEPTVKMLDGADEAGFTGYTGTWSISPFDCWKAMLSAAPHHPTTEKGCE